MTDGSVGTALTLLADADGAEIDTSNGTTSDNLQLLSNILGRNIVVNKRRVEELLKLNTQAPPTDMVTFLDSETGEDLEIKTSIPPVDAIAFMPIEIGEGVTLTTPVPSAVAGDGKDTAAGQNLSIDGAAQPETLTMIDAQSAGQLAAEAQAEPEMLTLAEALVSAGLTLAHKAVGTAYLPWEYPVQEADGTLRITQVYSAEQDADGVLSVT